MKTKTRQIVQLLTASTIAASLVGCASIVSGGPAKISVSSQPSGATVTVINNRSGENVDVSTTPTVLRLKRGAGYFKAAQYRLVIEKEGYQPAQIEISSSVNGWYFGNLFIGGLLGMLVVDPLTGSMYVLQPKNIDRVLQANGVAAIEVDPDESGLVVTLLEHVPADLTGSLQPVALQ
jgi:hypothetical protein